MSTGTCLCESVSWEITEPVDSTYHCHCSMCRKTHGASFATYSFVPFDQVKWTSNMDTVINYSSSASLDRPFCGKCGSVIPGKSSDNKFYYVPLGCHDDGPKPDCHIFTDSKAPWIGIDDDLPQYAAHPPEEEDQPVYQNKELSPPTAGVLRGGCLCGLVQFEVTESFRAIHNCHCTRCRRARAAAFTTNGFVSSEGVRFTSGEEHIKVYKVPSAKFFTHSFCDTCGSGVPRIDVARKISVIPMGSLDDDPRQEPEDHIFVEDKAKWYDIVGDLPMFDQYPK